MRLNMSKKCLKCVLLQCIAAIKFVCSFMVLLSSTFTATLSWLSDELAYLSSFLHVSNPRIYFLNPRMFRPACLFVHDVLKKMENRFLFHTYQEYVRSLGLLVYEVLYTSQFVAVSDIRK